jgi:hypothetical protein
MATKLCPHCDCVLPNLTLFTLDAYKPSLCDECGGFMKNTLRRQLLAIVLPILLIVGLLFVLHPKSKNADLIPLLVFVLWPFSQSILAKPVKVEIVESPCERCKRIDVGFRSPSDLICDKCLTRAEHPRRRKIRTRQHKRSLDR